MTTWPFTLIPFEKNFLLPEIAITGAIIRQPHEWIIRYDIIGDIGELLLPEPLGAPLREDELWKTTCLELFVALRDAPSYREFNFSPSGKWNFYCFDDYRNNGDTIARFLPDAPVFRTRKTATSFHLEVKCREEFLVPPGHDVDIGVSAVIESTAGGLSYWALLHPGPKPDFHRREGFALRP